MDIAVLQLGDGALIGGAPFRLTAVDWTPRGKERMVFESYDPLAPADVTLPPQNAKLPSRIIEEATVLYLLWTDPISDERCVRDVIHRVRVTDIEEEGPRWRRCRFYVEGIVS